MASVKVAVTTTVSVPKMVLFALVTSSVRVTFGGVVSISKVILVVPE